MIDAKHLVEFKRTTNEDLLVAGLISSLVDISEVKSILDVGAGTGLVSLALQRMVSSAAVTVVDISDVYEYPKDFNVIISDWHDVELTSVFDLVLYCHILGDFPVEGRMQQLSKGIDLLSGNGVLVSVENGPEVTFDKFVKEVFWDQGGEFNIDFPSLESELTKCGVEFERHSFETYLTLGRDLEEAVRNSNLFFPQMFKTSQKGSIGTILEKIKFGDRYVLPVTQRFYVASRNMAGIKRLSL